MDYKNFIIGLFLIVILFILLILSYRNYVYNYCKNDIQCLNKKLAFSIDNLNKINLLMDRKKQEQPKEEVEEEIEGFFNGITDWFSGSSPSSVPTTIAPGSLPNESLNSLEKKINDKMIPSKNFPPEELNGNTDDFKDADNLDILNNLNANFSKNNKTIIEKPITKQDVKPAIKAQMKQSVKPNNDNAEKEAVFSKKELDIKSIFGSCQFFNDKCPDNYHQLGNFSIQGISSNSILSCGNVQNTKPAKAVAQIKNNSIYEIHITDPGHGFNPNSSPKISIEGGKGHGGTAEAVIDDDGFLKLIKVINPGYNYSETPNVLIDAPFMNSSCHLCCKDGS